MCYYCNNIIEHDGNVDMIVDDYSTSRESLILIKNTNEGNKLRFFGINAYHYENDACYANVEVSFCPVCGERLV